MSDKEIHKLIANVRSDHIKDKVVNNVGSQSKEGVRESSVTRLSI